MIVRATNASAYCIVIVLVRNVTILTAAWRICDIRILIVQLIGVRTVLASWSTHGHVEVLVWSAIYA